MTATHLVTGAGQGIGAAVAAALHERGDHLLLLARSGERARELEQRWAGATTLVADLADPGSVERLDLPDRLDSLVHAAGVVDLGPVAEQTTASWTEQLAVNLVAPAVLTRRALPALREAGGTVVMVNSGQGLAAAATWGPYAAGKHGLRALADTLRQEEAGNGVRVTSVYPGRTATGMQEKVHAQEGKDYDADDWIQPGTVARTVLHVLDLPPDAVLTDVTVKPR